MKNLKMKKEFKVIADLLPNNTRVLDIGCGDGSLMHLLRICLLYTSPSPRDMPRSRMPSSA